MVSLGQGQVSGHAVTCHLQTMSVGWFCVRCLGFFKVSRWILWNIGGTIHAGMKAVSDILNVPDDLQLL